MKKAYQCPSLQVECYALDESIASNCGTKVNMGPGGMKHDPCSDWGGIFSIMPDVGLNSNGKSFYEDGDANCTCYYSSGDNGYFTS